VIPDAEIVLVDEADFLDRGGLDKDEAEAAERISAEMHDVEGTAGVAGLGAVMDHRRHHEAVLQRQAADRERLGKAWLLPLAAVAGSVTHGRVSLRKRRSVAGSVARMPGKKQRSNRMASGGVVRSGYPETAMNVKMGCLPARAIP